MLKEGGLFYFLSDHFNDFAELYKKYDWHVISHQPFNKQLEIGVGLMKTSGSAGWLGQAESAERLSMYKDVVSNLKIRKRDVEGMHVILFDDVLTNGQSFKQLRRKMMELGAKSVSGIFLGKTVLLND